jgi:hypothetical protein
VGDCGVDEGAVGRELELWFPMLSAFGREEGAVSGAYGQGQLHSLSCIVVGNGSERHSAALECHTGMEISMLQPSPHRRS